MSERTKEIPVYEINTSTVPVDCVVQVRRMGAVTHIVFAETREEIGGDRKLVREAQVRIAVPSDKVMLMARTILAGVACREWVMPHEENTLEDVAGHC